MTHHSTLDTRKRPCPTCGVPAGTNCRWLTATDPACDGRPHPDRLKTAQPFSLDLNTTKTKKTRTA